ncbi:MAG: M36 family metallopeptidase [Ferruginibacter sp.]
MKKFLLSFVLFSITFFLKAQDGDKSLAMQLVAKNGTALSLSADDLKNTIVNSTYFNKYAGTQMVYLQQSYLGLPVFNQILVLAFKDGKLVSSAGERISGMEQITDMSFVAPSVTPAQAVQTAIAAKKLSTKENITPAAIINPTKLDYGKLGISIENITAELMWVPLEKSKLVKLAWQVYVSPKNSADLFLIRVDALANKIISESNLTVYCNFDDDKHKHEEQCTEETNNTAPLNNSGNPSLVGTANYLVVPYPSESPIHPGGTPAVRTNPWLMAPGDATSLGWHNDGTVDYTVSRGNNVYAQEDRDNNNSTFGLTANSTTTPDPLNFNFPPDFTVPPTQTAPVPNQQFNITNLFYWNNITHDLTYLYGFDESAGNFQNSNQGRGGLGNDYVIADAQDAGGTNNANFGTPTDGQRPRMQMYLWNGSPQKDGDADNGIIVHEYGHGISNRLTGGPVNVACLGNAEQMGEGWSDYYALMYTQNWATSTLTTGFTTPRGIGTYALGQPFTGLGIRSQRYSTNFAVNSKVYAPVIPASPHDRGEIWCATLWDMTWNIINQVGTINPNLFNPAGGGGNAIALKLVTEGMKLQPCSPGFITGRNAILQADQILYNGLYSCAIKEAFRRRGMGDAASQGSSASVTDQITDFVGGGVSLKLTQNGMTQVSEGQNIVYTNTVNAACAAITGFTLRDTLPANVTYVSGGTYDPATRVVSFPVTQAANTIQTYTFTVNVNNGSYFPTLTLIDEQVTGPTIPAFWTTTSTPPGVEWTVSSVQSASPPNAFYVVNLPTTADQKLETTNSFTLPAGSSPKLTFAHRYNTEDTWDGGVVEISTNNGTTWADLGPNMISNGYNGSLSTSPNPLANRAAFTGTINSFITTTINLTPFAGQNVKIRFRFGSDDLLSAPSGVPGWFVDNILLKVSAEVNMRSSLFNASNVRIATSDTVTVIIPNVGCVNVGVSVQPANVTACAGNNATFSVTATGTSPTYQWQVSTNGGATFTDIPGATAASYTVTGVSVSMDNYRYRVVINNACPSTVTSAAAILTVGNSAVITTQPAPVTTCSGTNATFTVAATGSNLTYQWQVSTNGGTTWTNITGATSASYTITGVTGAMSGNLYRAVVFSCGPTGVNSGSALLTVLPAANITTQPGNASVCQGNTATFSVTAAGPGLTYQWQVSTNGGTTWTNITGAIGTSYTTPPTTTVMNGNQYRVVITSTCGSINSNAATLTLIPAANITAQPSNISVCVGNTATFSITATGPGLTYQWQVSTNGGSTFTDIAGATSATYTTPAVTAGMIGNQYRVVLSGTCGSLNSNAATLSLIAAVAVSSQPANTAACVGTSATFSVTATGAALTYQWQVSTNGGTTFTDIPGATSSTLTVSNVTLAMNGYQYRVVLNGTCNNLTSNAATLTINSPVAITAQPTAVSSCAGSNVSFTVAATGTSITYQWQVSVNNGPWVNLTNTPPYSGVNTNTLTINGANSAMNGYQYRVIVSGVPCGAVTSNPATLVVNLNPGVVLVAAEYSNLTPGVPSTLYTTVSPVGVYTYQWFRNGVLLPNVTTSSYPLNVDKFGDYTVTVTDLNGCRASSNLVKIRDSVTNVVFIYPNPNIGQFQVRFYSPNNETRTRMIVMYDSRGSKVYQKTYEIGRTYDRMDVNVPNLPAGIYMLELRDIKGERLASSRVIIQ